jgi:protease I
VVENFVFHSFLEEKLNRKGEIDAYTPKKEQTANTMSKTALVVIALKGFQDHELAGVAKGLTAHGFKYDLCGKESNHEAVGKFGTKQTTTVSMREANVDKYDRVAFIGGPGAGTLKDEPDALELARRFSQANKIIGAICVAPMILASAGLLKGKKATVWDSKQGTGPETHYLAEHGAHFVTQTPVVVDGKIVTGNGPDAAEEFGKVFATL